LIGDAAVAVVELASRAGKPIVLEHWTLREEGGTGSTHKPLARMLANKVISRSKQQPFAAVYR
jgi:hypothetical protein